MPQIWLSYTFYPYYPSLLAVLVDYVLCLYSAVLGKFLLVSQHRQVHWRTSPISSSLFLHQCLTLLVLMWMDFEIGCKWLYRCCFIGCCFQDLFNIVCTILLQFLSRFFSICFVTVHIVHPYSRIDTIAPWKKLAFYMIR